MQYSLDFNQGIQLSLRQSNCATPSQDCLDAAAADMLAVRTFRLSDAVQVCPAEAIVWCQEVA